MPEFSERPAGTAAARLVTDAETARKVFADLSELFAAEEVAISAFEDAGDLWSLTVHFRHHPGEAAMRETIAAAAGGAVAQALAFETLAATDWVRESIEGFGPVEAGRFVVHGAHARSRVPANRIGIEIEAGLAFGTGHHGSTRGCLLALDRIVKASSRKRRSSAVPSPTTVLDLGTGSGVLAIAAAKALRRPVLASDIDGRAVAIARDNARNNRVNRAVEVVHGAGLAAHRFDRRAPYATILANILLEPLQKLATSIGRLVAPNGRVVLAGLLLDQAAAALASYRARGFVLEQRIRIEGWVTLVLVRRRWR